jgi:hypothetical protein
MFRERVFLSAALHFLNGWHCLLPYWTRRIISLHKLKIKQRNPHAVEAGKVF